MTLDRRYCYQQRKVTRRLWKKQGEIPEDFYTTKAMTEREWMGADYATRWLTTGLVTHRYHHKVCTNKNYHYPGDSFFFELCRTKC
ncbi:hypothetical protein C0J52_26194 [Blattella germanica]|nr:hypothetical protein C0J52_26194 [Blattella germanica]